MAKPLDDRITAAMSAGARASTVADLITEVAELIESTQRDRDEFDRKSKSTLTSEADADAAADEVIRLERRVARLNAKKTELENRHAALMASERRRTRLAEYAEIKARRDQLVADLQARWPAVTAEIVSLLSRIEANDAEIEAFQKGGAPSGCEWLASAEAVARDCPGNWYRPGGSPILRFTKIKLPSLADPGIPAWPDERAKIAARVAFVEEQRRVVIADKERREAEAARWKRFMITPPRDGGRPRLAFRGGEADLVRKGEAWMSEEQAEAARAKGCTVELLKPNETVGLPQGGQTF